MNGTGNCMNKWDSWLDNELISQKILVENSNIKTLSINSNNQKIAVNYNTSGDKNISWVASLKNAYGPYARRELDLVGANCITKPIYSIGSKTLEVLLYMAGIEGGIFINNWLIATNIHTNNFDISTILDTIQQLKTNNPTNLPFIVRSLTHKLNSNLIKDLLDNDFLIIPTRQVWIIDNIGSVEWLSHKDVKRDIKLESDAIKNSDWIIARDFSEADWDRTVYLYNKLYREKYPEYNPAYTKEFFKAASLSGWMNLKGIRYHNENDLSGIVGVIERDNIYATPVLGYDTSKPQKLGLYRRLQLQAFNTTNSTGGILHCSGGAGLFKKQRGAISQVEFAAIYTKDMNALQLKSIKLLSKMLELIAVPYLEQHVL